MASIKEVVSFEGQLKGEGGQARCVVSALKVTLPKLGVRAFANYDVKSVSENLPDGRYLLTVNGETKAVLHQRGFWLAHS